MYIKIKSFRSNVWELKYENINLVIITEFEYLLHQKINVCKTYNLKKKIDFL